MRLANPKTKTKRKANPTPADFAALASGLLSTVQLGEHLGVMKTTKKRKTVKRKTTRRNPTAAASKLRNSATSKTATANPRKKVSVPAKGRFYLMTVAKGDDLLGVFINDRDGDGITKKFKSVAAAKAFATKNRLALENPAASRKVAINFAPKWVKDLLPVNSVKRKVNSAKPKAQKANPAAKATPTKANPSTAAKATPKANGWLSRSRNNSIKVILGNEGMWALVDDKTKQMYDDDKTGTRTAKLDNDSLFYPKAKAGTIVKIRMHRDTNPTVVLKRGWRKANPTTPKVKGQRSKVNPVKATPTAAKRNGVNKLFGKTFSQLAATAKRLKKKSFNVPDFMIGDAHVWIAKHGGSITKPGGRWLLTFANRNPTPKVKGQRSKVNPTTPKTSKTVATSKTSRTRNPVASVPRRRTFEMFNGRPATRSRVVPCSKLLGSGARVDQLGKLHEIHMESGEILKLNPNKFNLVAKGGRLWIVGGKFHSGPKVDRKINPWGKIKNIVYSTHKPHHGDRPGQHYIHEMGEWSGNRPTLSLDNEGFPVIQGGSYKIEDRGIVD